MIEKRKPIFRTFYSMVQSIIIVIHFACTIIAWILWGYEAFLIGTGIGVLIDLAVIFYLARTGKI